MMQNGDAALLNTSHYHADTRAHTYTALPTRILRVHEEHLVEVMIDVFVTERHEVDLLILTQPP